MTVARGRLIAVRVNPMHHLRPGAPPDVWRTHGTRRSLESPEKRATAVLTAPAARLPLQQS